MSKPKFDKKNAIKFANKIYDGKTGKFTKLCTGLIDDGELCCILGKARNYFTTSNSTETGFVCGKLASVAIVNQTVNIVCENTGMTKEDVLFEPLNELAVKNDAGSESSYKTRARQTKKFWMENIVPLLK